MKRVISGIVFVIICTVVGGLSGMFARGAMNPHKSRAEYWRNGYMNGVLDARSYIPSPRELQRRIGVKEDGIFGTETMKAWEAAYCEQMFCETAQRYNYTVDVNLKGNEKMKTTKAGLVITIVMWIIVAVFIAWKTNQIDGRIYELTQCVCEHHFVYQEYEMITGSYTSMDDKGIVTVTCLEPRDAAKFRCSKCGLVENRAISPKEMEVLEELSLIP